MESKDPKTKAGEENKDWEEIKDSNQIGGDSNTPINTNTPNQSKINQEIQKEEAELSEIETGSKGQPDFDEMISFNHTYLNYRVARCFNSREQLNEATFGLLLTNVFIYSGDAIDMNYMENLPNSEAVKNVRKKDENADEEEENTYKNVTFILEDKVVGIEDLIENFIFLEKNLF